MHYWNNVFPPPPFLDQSWQELLGSAFAFNTHRTYSLAQKHVHCFCQDNNFLHANGSPSPASEPSLLCFMGRMHGSFRVLYIMHGFQDTLINQSHIPLVIRGLQFKRSIVERPQKCPITALILHTLKLQLDLSKCDDIIMLWAAFCTAFFGFLWAAEFTCPHNMFSLQETLSVSSVSLDKQPVPDTVVIPISI